MELILIITCLFFIYSIYFFSRRDIMSPSMLLLYGYVAAIVCCMMNKNEWGVNLNIDTVIFLIIGVGAFVIAETFFLLSITKRKKIQNNNSVEYEKSCIINVSNIKIAICLGIIILNIFTFLKDIVRISGLQFNLFNMNEIMNTYRRAYSYEGATISSISIQLMKFSKGIAFVFLFIFFNNIFSNERIEIKSYLKYLLPPVAYLICTFLLGGRINMIVLCVACIFLVYYNWNRKYYWKKPINVKILKNICLILIVLLVIFYFSKSIVGRKSNKNFIDYITTYLGGSIQLLDEYLNNNSQYKIEKSIETFPGIMQSLYKLGFFEITTRKSLEFRHPINGEYLGNVYTGLRRYYNDFGMVGMIIIQIIYSLFFNILYHNIKYSKKTTYKSIFRVVFYSYTVYCLIIQSMEDHFFINISLGYILELMIIYCIVRWLININNNGKGEKIGDYKKIENYIFEKKI